MLKARINFSRCYEYTDTKSGDKKCSERIFSHYF